MGQRCTVRMRVFVARDETVYVPLERALAAGEAGVERVYSGSAGIEASGMEGLSLGSTFGSRRSPVESPLVPVCASVAWSLPSIVGLHVLTNDGGI